MDDDQFHGKVVLVTGSGRGIGREIALRFAREGADLVVNFFRNRQPAEDTATEIRTLGVKALVIKANVGDLDDLNSIFDQIESSFGRLDVMIHNAASGFNRPSLKQRPKGWEWTMNINARSLLFGAQRAAKMMQRNGGGKIVAISSLGSERVLPDYVAVGASKAALESLIRYLGVELAPMDIIVNAVSPGIVKTKALDHFPVIAEAKQEMMSEVASRTPTGRLCTAEDVANIVYFLCTPQANMICGQTIIVDGGYSLQARI